MWVGAAVWVVVVVAAGVTSQTLLDIPHWNLTDGQGDTLVNTANLSTTNSTLTNQNDNDIGEYDDNEEARESTARIPPDNSREGPGQGRARPFGGGRRQFGVGSGRGRHYSGGAQRQYGARQGGGSVGRRGRQFEGYQSPSDGENDEEASPDLSSNQMGAILLLLQRLSDRLVGIEALQRQRTERLDTINYRLTKIELQAEERKSVIMELSNSLRHRLQTSDDELDRINSKFDEISTGIAGLTRQNTDLRNAISKISVEQSERSDFSSSMQLQGVIATVHGLRAATQGVREEVTQLRQNLTTLTNITSNLNKVKNEMVTKQYLHQSLNEHDNEDSTMTQLAKLITAQHRGGPRGVGGPRQLKRESEDCWEVLKRGQNQSGVYIIQPRFFSIPFFVYCDMETDGGGWTVIQRREDGTVDFLREWHDYKHGFGNLAGEFWLGNEKIHHLTNQKVSELRVDLADFDQQKGYAVYSAFAVGSELEGYSLKMLGEYKGDAGDSLRYHVGRRFSTLDIDNDAWPERSCARDHQGAWWYRACETSNLNGRYLHGPLPPIHQYTGLYWYNFRGPQYSLWRSLMMVRRGGSVSQPVFKDFKEVQDNSTTIRNPTEDETVTAPIPENYNTDHDPYAVYEYPYY